MLMEEDGRRFPKQDANTSRVSRAVTLLNYQTGLYSVVFGITPVIVFFFFLLRVYLCALLCPKLPRLLFFFVNNDVGFQKLKARGQWMMPSQLELLNAGLAFISVWAFS